VLEFHVDYSKGFLVKNGKDKVRLALLLGTEAAHKEEP
jgi:hypothetical protein